MSCGQGRRHPIEYRSQCWPLVEQAVEIPRRKKKAWLLGLGLDNDDGQVRLTQGENFRLVGGSHDTHQQMQEKCIKLNEKLKGRRKRLEDLRTGEFQELASECDIHVVPPKDEQGS